ncbi:sirohydrochlorin chelatase [uncultured Mycolicibacterium sp.]|uniref:sirohydrochlorin chelatase n=1 Tax=uncultured Mycolicibacterium sp. TaxID=2320817 RepID=UPI00261E5922|nr:sirohydrochlorin chelatase [uncultured Mycolicibacterium sp.]
MTSLVLTAHGSVDPRSPAVAHAVADRIRALRPELDVRAAFCEKTAPNLRAVLRACPDAVVTPLLLASAYHANVDIPAMVADAPGAVRQAEVLGEDARLLRVMAERLAEAGVTGADPEVGVVVVAVGSSWAAVNARTATIAGALAAGTDWAGALTAFATGPKPTVAAAAERLRRRGARRVVIAPWFLAHGRITDRVAEFARAHGLTMAEPLGAHPLVAETVLDRFDRAVAAARAA